MQKDPGTKNKTAVENIATPQKDLGFKLFGTIVSGDSDLSRAIVHVQKMREQEIRREGDTAGSQVDMQKILCNKVTITTTEGDKSLTRDPEDCGRQRRAPDR